MKQIIFYVIGKKQHLRLRNPARMVNNTPENCVLRIIAAFMLCPLVITKEVSCLKLVRSEEEFALFREYFAKSYLLDDVTMVVAMFRTDPEVVKRVLHLP